MNGIYELEVSTVTDDDGLFVRVENTDFEIVVFGRGEEKTLARAQAALLRALADEIEREQIVDRSIFDVVRVAPRMSLIRSVK